MSPIRWVVLGLLVLSLGSVAGLASGSGDTAVRVTPLDRNVSVGESVTYEVVVGTVEDGVGAYEFTVTVSDPAVARITGVDLGPSNVGVNRDVRFGADNASVEVAGFGGNTSDRGHNVPVAEITVSGRQAGRARLSLDVEPGAVGDEAGGSYVITQAAGASVIVTAGTATDRPPTPTSAETTPAAPTTTERTATPTPTRGGGPGFGHGAVLPGIVVWALFAISRLPDDLP